MLRHILTPFHKRYLVGQKEDFFQLFLDPLSSSSPPLLFATFYERNFHSKNFRFDLSIGECLLGHLDRPCVTSHNLALVWDLAALSLNSIKTSQMRYVTCINQKHLLASHS